MKRIIIILFVMFSFFYSGCNLFSGDSFSNGIYINNDIGFSIEFPHNWIKVSRPDFVQSMAFTGVEQRLFISPSSAETALIAVATVDARKLGGPIPWDTLWNSVVKSYKSSGLKIELNTKENLNGIEVRRLGGTNKYYMGGQNAEYYTEIVLFALENGLVQLDMFFKKPVDQAMLSEKNRIISSIKTFE